MVEITGTTIRKDVQTREVRGGYVVIMHQRSVNDLGETVHTTGTEAVAHTGDDVVRIIANFLGADPLD